MTAAEDLTRALSGRWNGSGGKARCPAHRDRDPSLSISDKPDGGVLVHCHGGCPQETVWRVLLDKGLVEGTMRTGRRASPTRAPAPPTAPDFRALLKCDPVDFWDYRDAAGRLLGYTSRVEGRDGKAILPITHDGTAWRCKGFPEPRPLFGLPALAARPNDRVLLVEGEKTACAAQGLLEDFVVMTWPGGTAAVNKVDWSPLTGRKVTLWPDADDQGRKAMNTISTILLRDGAASVHAVKLPAGLPQGWDLADDLPADLDISKLLAEAVDMRAARIAKLPIKSATTIDATDYPEARWAVPGLVPDGVTILAGPKSRGKSFVALDLSVAVASGGPALGNMWCDQGAVLYLALEDGERRIQGRIRAILQGQPVPQNLDIATEWNNTDNGGLEDLELWLAARPNARLVVVDVLAKIKGRPDPQRGVYDQDYATITPFHALARKHGVAVVLVHHTNKGAASDPVLRISGTMGLSGAADTTLVLSREARDMHGTLDVRGRDVPERELALQFDRDTGCVTHLGAADDFRKSEERRAIIRILLDGGAMTPTEIAQALGKKPGTIRGALFKMKKAGEVAALANGKYEAVE
jgi:hypothetical protein